MLHQVVQMFEEIASEMAHEYSAFPVRMIAEVVQFVLLAAIVWVVAMGWGKRKGFVSNMLAERAEKMSGEIEVASHAGADLVQAEQTASERLEAAKDEARGLVEAAQADARQLETTVSEEAAAESQRIIERARAALATETEEMHAELREELVSIVAQASRAILSEKMSVAEQRVAIERAIVESIGAEPTPPTVGNNGSRKRARKHVVPQSGVAS